MDAVALEAPNLEHQLRRLMSGVVSALEREIAEWFDCKNALNEWRKRHLHSGEEPSALLLMEDKRALDVLIFQGQVLGLATSRPDFPRPDLAEQVEAGRFILQEMYLQFHDPNPMSDAKAHALLQQYFPDDPLTPKLLSK